MITPSQFRGINLLKLFSVILVVIIHSNTATIIPAAAQSESYSTFYYVLYNILLGNAVPAFFIMSGMLFFRNGATLTVTDYNHKLKRRATTLGVPYLLWNIIGLAVLLLKISPTFSAYFPAFQAFKPTIANIITGFFEIPALHNANPFDGPLWFVRNLIIIVLLAPILSLIIRALKQFTLIILPLCTVAVVTVWPELDAFQLLKSITIFTCGGAYIAWINGTRLQPPLWAFALTFIAILAVQLNLEPNCPTDTALYYFRTLIYTFGGIMLFEQLTRHSNKTFSTMATVSFFVFAMHALFSSSIAKIWGKILGADNTGLYIATMLLGAATTIAICTSTYFALRRIAPRLAATLCGNRK